MEELPRGALKNRANFSSELSKRNVPRSQAMSGTASNTVASRLPIPVLLEATRSLKRNLLTRRTVLVQRNSRWSVKREDRPAASAYRDAESFHSRCHFFQSFLVAVSMALAALCSQRPRRVPKSCFTLAMACGVEKCMLAVSQPME
jgi:hypothetical protein